MLNKKITQEIYTVSDLEYAVARRAEAGGNYDEMVGEISEYLGDNWQQFGGRKVTVRWPEHCWTKSVSEFSSCEWTDLGVVPKKWFEDCRLNASRSSIEDWFAGVHNARSVEIDKARNVYVCFADRDGRWMSQESVDETIEMIEAGV